MTNEETKQLALDLLHADSEDDVISILRARGLWENRNLWRLYGDKPGNFSQVGNQQSFPEAALVEKIINSVDARLMLECLRRDIDPESEKAPTSIRDAVAMFFEDRRSHSDEAGALIDWSEKMRGEESRKITVAATGDRPTRGKKTRSLCLTITDLGEGQSPKRLPETILSLNAKNKQTIRFVQGKFNMGGSGALRFCGKQGLQLVISKRNPELAKRERSTDSSADRWSVTIVRREEPSNLSGEPVHSEFTYLAPVGATERPRAGDVLSFSSPSMPMMPLSNRPYAREMEWGTAIKLYEYKTTTGQSNVLLPDGLLYAFDRLLPEIALPIRLHECRGYKGADERSFDTPIAGLVVRLEQGRGNNLESDFPDSAPIFASGMKLTARIYAFKEGRAATYLKDEGVIFEINGQAHGYLPNTIFSRPKSVGLQRLKDSLLVLVDCSTLSARQREDLFMTSRDRLSRSEIRYALELEIEQMLREHKGLRRLQQERRDKDVQSQLSDDKPLEEVLSKVLKSSPTLEALFLKGQRLSKPFARQGASKGGKGGGDDRGEEKEEYKGRRHPTYFKVEDSPYGSLYRRSAELGRRCRIKFKTDVENGYFNRSTDQGTFDLEVVESSADVETPNHSVVLEDGVAYFNMMLPDGASVDDWFVIQATVNDPTLIEPFVNLIKITVTERAERKGGSPKKAGGEKLALPTIIPVQYGDECWHRYKFTEKTATHVISDRIDDSGEYQHVFYINVDNVALLTEMKYSKQDARLMRAKFIYGNVLLGLAVLHEAVGSESDDEFKSKDYNGRSISPGDDVRRFTQAVAPMLIPIIDQLSGLTDSELIEFSELGQEAA